MSKTWFITGASRGLGAAIARAALDAGDTVVACARNRDAVTETLGAENDALMAVSMDVTDTVGIRAAVDAAVQRFGRIDVLVNNAGYGHLGLFEETVAADAQAQYATNVFGLFEVTRAVLPVMRRQRSGRIFNIASMAGIKGGESGTLYCSSKFAVEGFSESLAEEVRRFGIGVTVVEPGFFRTDFLDARSVRHAGSAIADYAEADAALRAFYDGRNHNQAGDPERLGQALLTLANAEAPPVRFCAGTDAIAVTEAKIASMQAELDAWRTLSSSTDGDFAFREEGAAGSSWD